MVEQVIHDDWRALIASERDILVALARAGPASGADVHRRLRGEAPSTEAVTSRYINRLEEKGYLRRDHQGREKICHLTDAGEQLVRRGVLEPASAINVQVAER